MGRKKSQNSTMRNHLLRRNNSNFKLYHRHTQYILIGAIILFIIFGAVVVNEAIDFSKIKSPFRGEELITIQDQCSYIMGNLVHQIRDEDDCSMRCYNECLLDGMDKKNSFLELGNNSCHTCKCYCR